MSQEDREELIESQKLLEDIRRRALEVIDRGPEARRRPLREAVMAASHALKGVLESIERWAGP